MGHLILVVRVVLLRHHGYREQKSGPSSFQHHLVVLLRSAGVYHRPVSDVNGRVLRLCRYSIRKWRPSYTMDPF